MKLTEEQEKNRAELQEWNPKTVEVPAEFLYSIELLSEVKTLTNEQFLELKALMTDFLYQEFIRRFGEYQRPVPRKSNNY